MSYASIGVVFFINWLIVFFIFLPIGIKVSNTHIIGNAKSAPEKTNLYLKILFSFFTSLISSFISVLIIEYHFY